MGPSRSLNKGGIAIRLFLQTGGPFRGCPPTQSATIGLGSILGPLLLRNYHTDISAAVNIVPMPHLLSAKETNLAPELYLSF